MTMHVASYDVARANAPHQAALLEATRRVLDAGRLILGQELAEFEHAFATYCGAAHCVGVGNGLDALTLALRALDIGPGHEVVVPAFTFVATWLAVTATGARPVPVDVDHAGLIDPALIHAALTPRTRAIIPVHLYGALADMAPILAIAEHFGLHVIEDAAQAHGAGRDGVKAGAFGTAAAFSFYPTKNLGALGDGGAVCTNDRALADRLRRLRNYGSAEKYHHVEPGSNSRLDTLQAAFLNTKLPHLDAANDRRRAVAHRYREGLADLTGLALPAPSGSSVWHQFVIRSPARDRLQYALAVQGVGTCIHYPVAPYDQPCFTGQHDPARFPVATRLAATVLSLPMADYLSDEDVAHVIAATRTAAEAIP